MYNVLVVDDSKLVRNFFLKKLERYQDKFYVRTAENGADAVKVMGEFDPHIIVTDLEMPVMDGFELLAHMNKNKPNVPAYVMTAKGSPEIEQRINSLGNIKYFEKPLDIDKLADHITADLAENGAKGMLQGIMLVSFLQLIEVESKTCTLTVSSGISKGTLICMNGKLLNASVGNLKGLDAAYEMIAWENAVIEISNAVQNKAVEITAPLVNVIMEGISRKDEKAALQ